MGPETPQTPNPDFFSDPLYSPSRLPIELLTRAIPKRNPISYHPIRTFVVFNGESIEPINPDDL